MSKHKRKRRFPKQEFIKGVGRLVLRDIEDWGQRKQYIANCLGMSRQTLDDALMGRTKNAPSTWLKIAELRFLSHETQTLAHVVVQFDDWAITGDIYLWWDALRDALRDGTYDLPPLQLDEVPESQLPLPFEEKILLVNDD